MKNELLETFSNVLNSLIKITWRQKTNNNTKENKQNENNNNKRRKNAYMHCHRIYAFTYWNKLHPKRIYRVIYIGGVPFEI